MLNYLIAGILGIAFYIFYQKFQRRKLPPGPLPLPLIGNLLEIGTTKGNHPAHVLDKLAKKYGEVMSLQVGVVPTVVFSGYQAARNAFKSEVFDNRIDYDWVIDRIYGKQIGVIFSTTSGIWKESRRIAVKTMKEFGFGKTATMDALIEKEILEFMTLLKKTSASDGTFEFDTTFNGPMVNIVWSLVSGYRFDLDDPEFSALLRHMNGFVRAGQLGGCNVLGAYPFLINYFPGWTGFTELHNRSTLILEFIEKVVQSYRDAGIYKSNPTNFIESFLSDIDNNNRTGESEVYTDQNLVALVADFFIAGSETSGNTLLFGLRYMIQHPEIQRRIQADLDSVVGPNRMVTLEDKLKLQYVDATALEVLRHCNTAPAAPRLTIEDVTYGPYDIPKGTTVLVNLYSAHMDKSVWGEDAHTFRPDRFLNNGKIVSAEKLMAFSIGRRNCIGEQTARSSFFLFFANLLKNFNFEVDPKSGPPSEDVFAGFSLCPIPFRASVSCR